MNPAHAGSLEWTRVVTVQRALRHVVVRYWSIFLKKKKIKRKIKKIVIKNSHDEPQPEVH